MIEKDDSTMGIAYQAKLPVSWKTVSSLDSQHLQDNSIMLGIISQLDEPETQHELTTENTDITRLESKLDLVINMLGKIMSQSGSVPATKEVKLSAAGITWYDDNSPEKNSIIEIGLYLSERFLFPVYLQANVTAVENTGSRFCIHARFESPGEHLQSWLEKYIFRQHRRAVAHHNHH